MFLQNVGQCHCSSVTHPQERKTQGKRGAEEVSIEGKRCFSLKVLCSVPLIWFLSGLVLYWVFEGVFVGADSSPSSSTLV